MRFAIHDTGGLVSVKSPTKLTVCKPSNRLWFRTFPDRTKWPQFQILASEDGFDREHFIVTPEVAGLLSDVAGLKIVVPTMRLEGGIFFWPIPAPVAGRRPNSWTESALIIAEEAQREWRRMTYNAAERRYDRHAPLTPPPDPSWPTWEEMKPMLELAFKDRIISSPDHPEVKKLLLK